MNTKMLRFMPIALATILLVGAVFTISAKKRSGKVKPVASIAQDIRNLESTPVASYADCKVLKSKIETKALPCYQRSFDKSAVTNEQKTKAVMSRLDDYAEQKMGSTSTFDMADAGFIHKVCNSYFTIVDYDQMLSKAPSNKVRKAIEGEIDAWIILQNALQDYCSNASYLENYGGSMALLGVSGSGWTLSQIRFHDIKDLLRIGMRATASKLSMGNMDIATTIVQDLSKNAKTLKESVDDDFKQSQAEYYDTFSKGITDAVKKVAAALPKWLEARKNMLQYTANTEEAVQTTKSVLEQIKTLTSIEEK